VAPKQKQLFARPCRQQLFLRFKRCASIVVSPPTPPPATRLRCPDRPDAPAFRPGQTAAGGPTIDRRKTAGTIRRPSPAPPPCRQAVPTVPGDGGQSHRAVPKSGRK